MKWIAFFLSFYILMLSAAPCCEVEACCPEQEQAMNDPHPEKDHACTDCPPFTVCGACNTFSSQLTTILINRPVTTTSNNYVILDPAGCQDYVTGFWKPPRFS